MVNRACYFCSNSYRKNPQAGYFRVTQTMRAVLGLRDQENTQQDFVCGLHFPEDCFLADGRLKAGSVPSFFPYLAAAEHDHTYNQPGTTESPEYDGDFENIPNTQSSMLDNHDSEIYSEEIYDDQDDPIYQPSESQNTPESSSGIDDSESFPESQKEKDVWNEGDPIKCPKVIVFMSALLVLLQVCRKVGCGQAVDTANIGVKYRGGCVIVTTVCNAHHSMEWSSSPLLGVGKFAVPAVNLVIGCYTFLTGLHVDQVVCFFRKIHCKAPGLSYMYSIQSTVLYKVVYDFWLRMQAKLIFERKSSSTPLHLGGDGKYDSPGFRARYCNYIIMDLETHHVLSFFTAIKHQVQGGSANMEPFACKTLLVSLVKDFQIDIRSFTTDRSSSISTMMASDPRLSMITHEYDPWHMIKCIMKDVWKACKAGYCSGLKLWKDSINCMLWWSFATSRDEVTLREKILSIPHHVSNNHHYPNNLMHKKCAHGDLSLEERNKPWLKEGSKELSKLRTALTGSDNGRLNDLSKMKGFHHTGPIENLNSLGNKYANKAYVYSYEGMSAREALTVIDHNSNLGRAQAKTKDGVPRVKTECDRGGQSWHVRDVMVPKRTAWMDEIAEKVVQCVVLREVPDVDLPTGVDLPKNQSKVEKPSKEQLIQKHQTRIKLGLNQ